MSYDECFERFKVSNTNNSKYDFTIMLASMLPSQKTLCKVMEAYNDPEEIDRLSYLIFTTLKSKNDLC